MSTSKLFVATTSSVTEPPKPIFVVGYMHSGTTLLHAIFDKHPAVFASRGEARFFEQLPALRRRFSDLSDLPTRERFVTYVAEIVLLGAAKSRRGTDLHGLPPAELAALATAVDGDHVAVFCSVFSYLMSRAHKSRWLERTPTHVFHIDEILMLVEGAKILEITRDPRDILASKKTRRETVWTSERYSSEQRSAKDLEKAYDPLWDSLSWKSAIRAGRIAAARHPGAVMRVRYEALVSHPERTTRDICTFLELEYAPEMVEVRLKTTADWNGRDRRDGIYTSSIGRWQSTLDPCEVALCQALVGEELRELDLAEVEVDWRDKLRMLALLPRSQRELFVRLERRWKMGGFEQLRRVVGAYGKRLAVLTRN